MQTYRNKFYVICDEEVIANNEVESKVLAKQQLEEKLYKTDINFVEVVQTKSIDATTANKMRRI
jgi:hypothetical protein